MSQVDYSRSFIFSGSDGMYVAYPLGDAGFNAVRWQRRVEFLFSQIFGTCGALATSASVYYLLIGDAPYCVASAVLSSFCFSLFWKRVK